MIDLLEREHPEYRNRAEMWQRYWDFYVGGEQLRRNASQYLVRRQKEPNDVYSERLARVFYENYLGSCVDWYAATLFRRQPGVSLQSKTESTQKFYSQFLDDCDRRGTSLLEVIRKAFIQALIYRESFVLVDFPKVAEAATNRAAEDALGKSRAYLASYSPRELVNWKVDERGEYEWIVLKTTRSYQEQFDKRDFVQEQRWAVYDRERFRVYVHRNHDVEGRSASSTEIPDESVELVDEGRHALADSRRVPLVKMAVTDGLWLANKAALLQLEHFNKSNALSWALHMGLFAMPVVYSEREWQQIVGEAYYIQLGPEDRFGWTEPEGHVFQIAADNIERLKDEIYRVCYLITQAAGREARHLGQSGDSKRRDFAVTHEVLRAYGGVVKEFLRKIIGIVALARRDDVRTEITGMDQFDVPDFAQELDNALRLQQAGIPSRRFETEVQKRVALQYLDGASQETKREVIREIEAR